jgi:hypothetical protein
MRDQIKHVEDLTVNDLKEFPVWQYINVDKKGETAVRPIKKIPVRSLNGRLVGTQIELANGAIAWATIENVDIQNAQLTSHFLTLSVFNAGRSFTLARYHDISYREEGPEALAAFLGLNISDVFPISYNLSQYCIGDSVALIGTIDQDPKVKLTRAQIIALAVP